MTLTPEQLANRLGAIGGSDCAAVLGVSRFKTCQQLYFEKRGELPVHHDESLVLRLGQVFEPGVRQIWSEDTGRIVRQPTGTLAHPEYPELIAHLDGFTGTGADLRGYEGKLALRSIGWGLEGTDQIPLDALFQTQHYMAVTGIEVFDVVVLSGWRIKTYIVPADTELQSMILEAELEFLQRLKDGLPPPLDYQHKTALSFIKERYPGTNGERVTATDELIHCRLDMIEAQTLESEAHKRAEACKVRLLEFMGPRALLDFPDGKSLRRKAVDRPAYEVPPSHFVESRFINTPRSLS